MQPAGAQSLSQGLSQSQQPSQQQIEAFCANWGQLSGSEKKQYRDQYERYCRDEPVFGRPVEPQPRATIIHPAGAAAAPAVTTASRSNRDG